MAIMNLLNVALTVLGTVIGVAGLAGVFVGLRGIVSIRSLSHKWLSAGVLGVGAFGVGGVIQGTLWWAVVPTVVVKTAMALGAIGIAVFVAAIPFVGIVGIIMMRQGAHGAFAKFWHGRD